MAKAPIFCDDKHPYSESYCSRPKRHKGTHRDKDKEWGRVVRRKPFEKMPTEVDPLSRPSLLEAADRAVKDLAAAKAAKGDPVKHPSHYTSHPSGVECLTITRHMNFSLGNAVKYIWRAGLKSKDPVQDLEKAVFYLQDEIRRLQGT